MFFFVSRIIKPLCYEKALSVMDRTSDQVDPVILRRQPGSLNIKIKNIRQGGGGDIHMGQLSGKNFHVK